MSISKWLEEARKAFERIMRMLVTGDLAVAAAFQAGASLKQAGIQE